jgi:hypothetical protein
MCPIWLGHPQNQVSGKIDVDFWPKHSLLYLIIPFSTLVQHESVYNRENDTKRKVFFFRKSKIWNEKGKRTVMTLWENIASGRLRMLPVSYEGKYTNVVLYYVRRRRPRFL